MLGKVRAGRALLTTFLVLSVGLVGTLANTSVAQASEPAPCVWHKSSHKITCEYGPRMFDYIEIKGKTASEEAEYAGGVLYYVFCTAEYSCSWSRVN
jgi:hypothetical protein